MHARTSTIDICVDESTNLTIDALALTSVGHQVPGPAIRHPGHAGLHTLKNPRLGFRV